MSEPEEFKKLIQSIPDFPEPGILFRDINPLLANSLGFQTVVRAMAKPFVGRGITKILGIESRGFILGAAVAYELGCGFAPVRKAGKLPGKLYSQKYSLEYGEDQLQMQEGLLDSGDRVLIVDDVLATGGTLEAAVRLCEQAAASVVALAVLVELKDLRGRVRLSNFGLHSIYQF